LVKKDEVSAYILTQKFFSRIKLFFLFINFVKLWIFSNETYKNKFKLDY